MRSEPVEAQLLEHLATKKLQKNLANNELVQFSLSESHRDNSIRIHQLSMSNFFASNSLQISSAKY